MAGQEHWSAGGRILLSSRGHKSTDTEERILFWERNTIQYMHGPYFSQEVISLDFISPAYTGGKNALFLKFENRKRPRFSKEIKVEQRL